MATFSNSKATDRDWAEEDSDNEGESATWHDTGRSPLPVDQSGGEAEPNDDIFAGQNGDDSDDSESESEDESEEENEGGAAANGQLEEKASSAKATKKTASIDVSNLSKKERLALKAKELDDLDSILAEVGIAAPTKVAPASEAGGSAETKKKNKKKKNAETGAAVPKPVEEAPIETVKDIKAVLAMKKVTSTKKASESATSAAVAEALKAEEEKKSAKKSKKAEALAKRSGFDR